MSGTTSRVRTPIESRIAAILEAQGIPFREQVTVGRYTCDFLILGPNGGPTFLLECDGAAYHDPERDQKRDTEIAAICGLGVLRLTGKQINFAPEEAKRRIKEYLCARTEIGSEKIALSAAQREVVTAPLGPMLVYAPAGSGKTRVLVDRIAHLLQQHNLDPKRICALTFTTDAATEIRNRVAQDVSGAAAEAMTIGTFHRLAGIVRIAQGYEVVEDDRRNAVLFDAAKKARLAMPQQELGNQISRRKADLIDARTYAEQLNSSGEKDSPRTGADQAFAEAWINYEQQLRDHRECDYDDLLLWLARKGLDDPGWSDRLSALYDYVLVDEAQDNNLAQDAIVKVLVKRHKNLMVVGDDDQSIYGFRGANPSLFVKKEREYGARAYFLDLNFRSHPKIVTTALGFVTGEEHRRPRNMIAPRIGEGHPVSLHRCNGPVAEARDIATHILAMKDAGHDWGNVAVLVRSNFQTQLISHELARAEIPRVNYSDDSILKKRAARVLIAYMRVFGRVATWDDWNLVLRYPNRYISNVIKEDLKSSSDILATWEGFANSLLKTDEAWRGESWMEQIQVLRRFLSTATIEPSRLAHQIREEFALDNAFDQIIDGKVVFSGIPFLQYVESMARAFSSVTDFFGYLSELLNPHRSTGKTNVRIMTIHRSKGLEFPCVVLAGLARKQFPHVLGDPAEERRLCYVALTRARDELVVMVDAETPSAFGPELERCIKHPISIELREGERLPNFPFKIGDRVVRTDEERSRLGRVLAHSSLHGILLETGTGTHIWVRVDASRSWRLYRQPTRYVHFSIDQEVVHWAWGKGTVVAVDDDKGYRVEFSSHTSWISGEGLQNA